MDLGLIHTSLLIICLLRDACRLFFDFINLYLIYYFASQSYISLHFVAYFINNFHIKSSYNHTTWHLNRLFNKLLQSWNTARFHKMYDVSSFGRNQNFHFWTRDNGQLWHCWQTGFIMPQINKSSRLSAKTYESYRTVRKLSS